MAAHDYPFDPETYARALAELRARKDAFFSSSADSPIPEAERSAEFAGLRYFPPDLSYRVEAEVIPFANPETVMLGSTGGDIRPQVRYADLRFVLQGQPLHLAAFTDPEDDEDAERHVLFVPFRDATSGVETYGAGRYLEADEHMDADGSRHAVLDFNMAYSPWCAYSVEYSCTLPPPENTLDVPIRAGEQTYQSHE